MIWEGMDAPGQAAAPPPRWPKTIRLTVDYLRPGLAARRLARARVNRSGRPLCQRPCRGWQGQRARSSSTRRRGHFLCRTPPGSGEEGEATGPLERHGRVWTIAWPIVLSNATVPIRWRGLDTGVVWDSSGSGADSGPWAWRGDPGRLLYLGFTGLFCAWGTAGLDGGRRWGRRTGARWRALDARAHDRGPAGLAVHSRCNGRSFRAPSRLAPASQEVEALAAGVHADPGYLVGAGAHFDLRVSRLV